ncbi:hypothetical protein J416_12824 [Gracilibacillus halophilus YIM-C55.5]|uniref:Uncharacterized protein n=1 Tax=Gracilibacillus halophilus YIM-C55.5 TaxID=1308866 RepID=N4W779_9BACI|nr:hypothetical protein [Gracilibacillus halophilus]ENH96088.1 hypothetical protein J416_12824 [Gracilibacillus halophilus YIM-C55.5]
MYHQQHQQEMVHPEQFKQMCEQYMNYHVLGELNDGTQFEGIIVSINQTNVTILVAEDVDEQQITMNRQFGYAPGRRYRRYRRRTYPFNLFRGLFLYPFFYPSYPNYGYPYYY